MSPTRPVVVGVLALQGSFREHVIMLNKLANVEGREVRTKEQLLEVDSLIIPGGESTTMALIAERWGLIPDLQSFAAAGHPVWGTCAGLIFLADRATGQKEGGQALLGGLDCLVHRNFFGSQIDSFVSVIQTPSCLEGEGEDEGSFKAVFIRAPAVMEVGEGVEIVAEYKLTPKEKEEVGRESVAVAVKKGPLLATAFHPELTDDLRWHQMFVRMTKIYLGNGKDNSSGKGLISTETQPHTGPEENGCSSSSATSEGWEHISVSDDFGISLAGSEAKITYDDKLVARAQLEKGGVQLKLEPSLQGRRAFPMKGFAQAFQRAEQMLTRA